jgi:hypothetical protein
MFSQVAESGGFHDLQTANSNGLNDLVSNGF